MLFAADPYERQPVIDLRIKKAIRGRARLRRSPPSRPGLTGWQRLIRYTAGQLGAVARGLLNLTLAEDLARGAYIEARIQIELAKWRERARQNTRPETRASTLEALRALAREIAGAKGAVLLYDEMARANDGATLAADLLNLALVTGNLAVRARALARSLKTTTRWARAIWACCPYAAGLSPGDGATPRGGWRCLGHQLPK